MIGLVCTLVTVITVRWSEIGHFAFRRCEIGHSDASRVGHYGDKDYKSAFVIFVLSVPKSVLHTLIIQPMPEQLPMAVYGL